MEITLYSFNKRQNSTKIPASDQRGALLQVTLKEGTSILYPSFVLSGTYYDSTFNYVKWDNRYYFITDVSLVRYNVYELTCAIDILGTYKTEIGNTAAFVAYSESNYNADILDNRLSMDSTAAYSVNTAQLLTDGSTTTGTYIVNYVTDVATYGATGLLWTGSVGVDKIARELTNESFFDLRNFEKQFANVYQALLGCKWVPLNWFDRFLPGGDTKAFSLGSFIVPEAVGLTVKQKVEYSVNVDIPWQFSDFRRLQPYTSFLLYLPAYGLVDIDSSDIIGKTQLTVKLTVDGVTGEGTYIVDKFFKGSCNFAVSVPIGTVSSNITGFWGGGLQTATSVLAGDSMAAKLGGGIQGLASQYFATKQRTLGNIGGLGSSAPIFASVGDDWRNVYLISICHDTTVAPDSVKTIMGRPLQEVKTINTLAGYVQTSGASVSVDNIDIAEQINNALDGGIYYE